MTVIKELDNILDRLSLRFNKFRLRKTHDVYVATRYFEIETPCTEYGLQVMRGWHSGIVAKDRTTGSSCLLRRLHTLWRPPLKQAVVLGGPSPRDPIEERRILLSLMAYLDKLLLDEQLSSFSPRSVRYYLP